MRYTCYQNMLWLKSFANVHATMVYISFSSQALPLYVHEQHPLHYITPNRQVQVVSYAWLASFTRPKQLGLLLTACACAKLLDNIPVMFPIKLNFYPNYILNNIYRQRILFIKSDTELYSQLARDRAVLVTAAISF